MAKKKKLSGFGHKKWHKMFLLGSSLVAAVIIVASQFSLAGSPWSSTVNVKVTCGGSVCPAEDKIFVYLYKGDNMDGKNYNQTIEADDATGIATFTKVPAQEMYLMVGVSDVYTNAEGFKVQEWSQSSKIVKIVSGKQTIEYPVTYGQK